MKFPSTGTIVQVSLIALGAVAVANRIAALRVILNGS